MNPADTQILLIEDNPGDARIIREWLKDDVEINFRLVHCASLCEGLSALAEDHTPGRLILLDLNLPDSHGIKTLYRVRDQAPDLPIVVLTGFDDEATAILAVQSGAQDYLVKDHLNGGFLIRAIRYALERHSLQVQLARLSMVDDLTELYNRRGFFKLAEQQMELSRRHQKRLLLVYADVDYLKKVNDELGHDVGDQLLVETADILRKSFRSTDILARIGGDEFAVLAIEFSDGSPENLLSRIETQLAIANLRPERRYAVSLSLGAAIWDPESGITIDALMAEADRQMYYQKKEKHHSME
ncbi:MAG TPA: GGDEF domain-containing response regulator [Anaerolineaceae bacterium]|nr:GGDEF domain-containing response regulator [Anaerolineaceae bacterium]